MFLEFAYNKYFPVNKLEIVHITGLMKNAHIGGPMFVFVQWKLAAL